MRKSIQASLIYRVGSENAELRRKLEITRRFVPIEMRDELKRALRDEEMYESCLCTPALSPHPICPRHGEPEQDASYLTALEEDA